MSAETERAMIDAIYRHFVDENEDADADWTPALQVTMVYEGLNGSYDRFRYTNLSSHHEGHICEAARRLVEPFRPGESDDPGWDYVIDARPDLLV